MNYKNLKKVIKDSYLTEVGDLKRIIPYDFNKLDKSRYTFTTKLGKVTVRIEKFYFEELEGFKVKHNDYDYDKPFYNIGYDIDGVESQIAKSNYKELIKILKTVALIVEDFIDSVSPYALVFVGGDKGGGLKDDKQKNSLYFIKT